MAQMQPEAVSVNEHEAAAIILTGIARAVVQSPDKVAVQTLPETGGALLTLQVDPADYDLVVGGGGRTARSLRTVLTALGKRNGQRFSLDIQSHTS